MNIEAELPSKIKSVLERKEDSPRRVFVDLGSGVFPAAFVGNQEFKGNDYYVGVDANKAKIEHGLALQGDLLKNSGNRRRVGENVFFIHSPVRNLPFPESSVDEVLLGNVLGDDAIHHVDPFLQQARRILKTGGVLIVLETITPGVAEGRGEDSVSKFVESFGFKKLKEVPFSDPDFIQEVSKYALHSVSRLTGDLGNEFVGYFVKEGN